MEKAARTSGAATAGALLLVIAWATGFLHVAQGAEDGSSGRRAMPATERLNQGTGAVKIRLTLNGKTATATLIDNATATDFLALLPMTVTLEDYAQTEKISYLPRKLSAAGAPAGIDPSVGDITYYAPWGNLAIFYKDFGYSRGLIHLGRLDSGIDLLQVPGPQEVTFEAAGK